MLRSQEDGERVELAQRQLEGEFLVLLVIRRLTGAHQYFLFLVVLKRVAKCLSVRRPFFEIKTFEESKKRESNQRN